MRTSAVALLALAGCNGLFGLDATKPWDASVDTVFDGPLAHLTITRHVLVGLGSTATSTDAPIGGLEVQVGGLDGVLYPVAADDQGIVGIPLALSAQPYRLVYRVPGDPVIHEVQWQGGDGAYLSVPTWGRVPRTAPPDSMDFVFHVTNPPSTFVPGNVGTVVTTGQWTRGTVAAANGLVIYPYWQNARSLAGVVGTPDAMHGEQEVLVELEPVPGTPDTAATGFATMISDLTTSTTGTTTSWQTGPVVSMSYNSQLPNPLDRVPTILSTMVLPRTADFQAGDLPSLDMPVMTEPSMEMSGGLPSTGAYVSLASYTDSTRPLRFADPFTGQGMKPALLARLIESRTVGGVALQSGFQQMGIVVGANNELTYDVGIASSVQFAGKPLLAVPSDGVAIALHPHTLADLTFAVSGGARTSDCIVTLWAYPSPLTPVRTFLVLPGTPTTVKVPTDDFQSGNQYAFEISCTDQYKVQSALDFRSLWDFPRSTSTLIPATFVVTLQ